MNDAEKKATAEQFLAGLPEEHRHEHHDEISDRGIHDWAVVDNSRRHQYGTRSYSSGEKQGNCAHEL